MKSHILWLLPLIFCESHQIFSLIFKSDTKRRFDQICIWYTTLCNFCVSLWFRFEQNFGRTLTGSLGYWHRPSTIRERQHHERRIKNGEIWFRGDYREDDSLSEKIEPSHIYLESKRLGTKRRLASLCSARSNIAGFSTRAPQNCERLSTYEIGSPLHKIMMDKAEASCKPISNHIIAHRHKTMADA